MGWFGRPVWGAVVQGLVGPWASPSYPIRRGARLNFSPRPTAASDASHRTLLPSCSPRRLRRAKAPPVKTKPPTLPPVWVGAAPAGGVFPPLGGVHPRGKAFLFGYG